MARQLWNTVYIDRDPSNPGKGWGWVEVTTNDLKRFKIPNKHPMPELRTRKRKVSTVRYEGSTPYEEIEILTYKTLFGPPARGQAGAKKFTVNLDQELVTVKAQKSLTVTAVLAWIKTWAGPQAKVITPGNRLLSLDGERLSGQPHFVYFLLNSDSKAIKIGLAKDLDKRIKSLQTSSPVQLKLLKSIQVDSAAAALKLERSLHQRFQSLRLTGEWFKVDAILLKYIDKIY